MKRRRDYDTLRVLSMLGVVYLHVAAGTLHGPCDTPLWYFSNLLSSLATAAVPLFFMISGALLLSDPKSADPSLVLRRRLPRVLVPAVVWSLLVVFLTWGDLGFDAALQQFLNLPWLAAITPYWFLYALVPMYLLLPFLKRLADHMEPKHWNYLMGLWVFLTLLPHTLQTFIPAPWNGLVTENTTLTVSLLEGYLGYFFLGAYLERVAEKFSRKVLWLICLADWAIIAVGTWWSTRGTGLYSEDFLSYKNLFAMVLAASLFLLAKSYLEHGRASGRALKFLSACSFGVYLSHAMAIKVVEWRWLLWMGSPSDTIPEQLAIWGLTVAACILGVAVCASIPGVCFAVTGQRFSTACRESNFFALFGKKRPND